MTAEEKKLSMSQNLSAALNNAKIENPVNVDPVTRKEITDKKSLTELKVEIKFHLNQMAGHAVEIGKLLIEAKEQVDHGEWYKWLEENFNLSEKMANNFMRVAERFGNRNLSSDLKLNQSQLIAMLSLPAGEEENFIAEKAAEGNPVEDMTVKNLKAEIADYKNRLAQTEQARDGYKRSLEIKEEQNEFLGEENEKLKAAKAQAEVDQSKLISEHFDTLEEKRELEEKIEELNNKLIDQELKTKTVEVAPADYEPMKKELADVKAANEKLQEELKELHDNPIEVSAVEYPADYDSMKSELAELKEKQKDLQTESLMSPRKKLENCF